MDNNLSGLIADGATFITQTQRLSRHLRYQYANQQIREGKQSWPTPDCLPWTAWCQRTFEQLSLRCGGNHILLNDLQVQWLWQQIISDSEYKDQLLQITATAQQVAQAYRLCKQWCAPIFPDDVFQSKDAIAFKSWVDVYEKQKKSNNWLDEASLPDYISSQLSSLQQSNGKIIFYDFDQLTQQQHNLIQNLKDHRIEVIEVEQAARNLSVSVSVQQEIKSEIGAAASWARQTLENNPEASIGIITPNLAAIRDKLDYGFASVLTPGKIVEPIHHVQQVYSISLGKPLSSYPLIKTAMSLLALGKRKPDLNNLSTLLHSPFMHGANDEWAERAKFDAVVRKIGEQQFSFKTLYWIAEERCKEHERCEEFIQLLKSFEISFLSHAKKQSLRQWAINFSEWLTGFGWPGERSLNSAEHQTIGEWQEALNQLGSLDGLSKPVSFSTALFQLNRLLTEKHFQPETPETPIQISGVTGAAGMQFDYLWIMDMQDESWPILKQPNAFIPMSCQRQFNMPNASADSQLMLAKHITNKLVQSAIEVVFSYAKQEGERFCRPSPLIKQWLLNTAEKLPESEDNPQTIIYESSQLEKFIDCDAPAIPAGQTAFGGSALFKDQSACPFKAFARHRLHAESLQHSGIGLSAAERGNLAHRSLQYLWQRLKTLEYLQYRSEAELDKLIHSVVHEAIKQQIKQQPETFTDRFTELEQLRLEQLLRQWLSIERDRSAFKVIATEEWKIVQFQDIELHLRVDRIDELADGRCVIIDYKTGVVSKNDWESDRPNDPQLPLYAVTNEQEVAAIAFGSLKRGKLGFVGQADSNEILPDIKQDNDLLWKDRLNQWKQVLVRLANDFRQGKATVEPTVIACRYCELHSLCRIYERVESPDDVALEAVNNE